MLREKEIKEKPFYCMFKSFIIGFKMIVDVIISKLKRFVLYMLSYLILFRFHNSPTLTLSFLDNY